MCRFPIHGKLAYASLENFLGQVVDGYHPDAVEVCLLTNSAAYALCQVQNELNQVGLGIFIYDAYRPLRAVKHFSRWFTQPVASEFELVRKAIHYPRLEKSQLVTRGYAPQTQSPHNFANTVDVTLINIATGQPLAMGTVFDYFDELSHHTVGPEVIGNDAYNNRCYLREVMEKHLFTPYSHEYWHFEYSISEIQEPLDIPLIAALQGLNVRSARNTKSQP
jgi:D-alanyl-D-alanine dipeptidase